MQSTSRRSERFPELKFEPRQDSNPAIQLMGRRFVKDQTVVEYLTEFMLVANSEKLWGGKSSTEIFPIYDEWTEPLRYKPGTGLALKFFTFFATSKLETRHPKHQDKFRQQLDEFRDQISGLDKDDHVYFVRALQSLMAGFAGVTQSRTWATQTFTPICGSLLSREVMWAHTKAMQNRDGDWNSLTAYFEINKHNFMARGGEALYLQILHLLNAKDTENLDLLLQQPEYFHLIAGECVAENAALLRQRITSGITDCLNRLESTIGRIAKFISNSWRELEPERLQNVDASLGWIPTKSLFESFLFAWELGNVLDAEIDCLEKVEVLKILCSLQVLRSICCRTAAERQWSTNLSFKGNYSWVPSPGKEKNAEVNKLACKSYEALENMIRTVMLSPQHFCQTDVSTPKEIESSLEDTQGILRKIGKQLGLVVPPTGQNMRMTLNSDLMRTLVLALVPPGKRVSLDVFECRLFHHFGIAVSNEWLTESARWIFPELPAKTNWGDLSWFPESLRSGGYLFPLSDAVSIVHNPYGKN